ncbi:hypothetical protein T12_5237 [Trichinella patagoniensis]|uniref:Uncharacterized protein n=1 Tax=Trichinella patagoniensis TaxID=990121 RepID=A0A0V0ZRU5_9BILA|nr:hypothetical protein T12_5237 [Trichinella patagoniensis]
MSDNKENMPLLNDESIVEVCPFCNRRIASWARLIERLSSEPPAPYHTDLYRESFNHYLFDLRYLKSQIMKIVERISKCIIHFSQDPNRILLAEIDPESVHLTNAEISLIIEVRESIPRLKLLLHLYSWAQRLLNIQLTRAIASGRRRRE